MTSHRRGRSGACGSAILALAVGLISTHPSRAAELGISRTAAIEVCGPNGEHAYFDRLTCPDGNLVKYEQIGMRGRRNDPASKGEEEAARYQALTSVPIPNGQRDFHMLDEYTVECTAGTTTLYVDRYHCPDPTDQRPPRGFSFLKGQAPGATPPPGERGLGLVKELAVEVCGPTGEREYLDRLRCPDGGLVRSQRVGSMGLRNDATTNAEGDAARQQFTTAGPIPPGQRDFHLVDGFSAVCHDRKGFLYLDPYHCPEPTHRTAPPGYSLAQGGAGK
jgi:hypothetical protein